MQTDYGHSGPGDRLTGNTGFGWIDYGFTAPTPRAAANGTRPGWAVTAGAQVSGYGAGNVNINAQLYNNSRGSSGGSGDVVVAGRSSAGDYVNLSTGAVGFFANESMSVRINASRRFYFARLSTGPGQVNDASGSFAGSLTGSMGWWQVPSAPTMNSYTPSADGKSAVLTFTGGDGGDTAITGWTIQWSSNADFTENIGTTDGLNGTVTIGGMIPGRRYYFRAAGSNIVSTWAGTTGPWSAGITGVQPAPKVGYRWNGSSFTDVKGYRWDGTQWVELTVKQKWLGAGWENIT